MKTLTIDDCLARIGDLEGALEDAHRENTALRKALADAPHGDMCASDFCESCEGPDAAQPADCTCDTDTCPHFELMPCDCWKSRIPEATP